MQFRRHLKLLVIATVPFFWLTSCQDDGGRVNIHSSGIILDPDLSPEENQKFLDLIDRLIANNESQAHNNLRQLAIVDSYYAYCIDPNLSLIAASEKVQLCDGTFKHGEREVCSSSAETGCITSESIAPIDRVVLSNVLQQGQFVGDVEGKAGLSVNPRHIRYGTSANGISGALKTRCKNMADIFRYDNGDGLATPAGLDIYDTRTNTDGLTLRIPRQNPWLDDPEGAVCGFNDSYSTIVNWLRVETDPVTAGYEAVFQDLITQKFWTRGFTIFSRDWDSTDTLGVDGAVEYCDSLDHGGFSNWRLPTQKELALASIHGINDLNTSDYPLANLGPNSNSVRFWTATTYSQDSTIAYAIELPDASVALWNKDVSLRTLCVSSGEE